MLDSRTPRRINVHEVDADKRSIVTTHRDHTVCNVILKIIVDTSQATYFEEEWHLDIYEAMSAWKGFLYRSTNVINVQNGKIEYVTILAFDNLENCRAWITSDARKHFMDLAEEHGMILYYVNEFGGASTDRIDMNEKQADSYTLISLHDMAETAFVPLPPPKWKLCLIIWFGVFLAVWLGNFSGIGDMMFAAGLPLYMVLLINLLHSVTVLSYTFFPLFMSIPFVEAWLKLPRPPSEQLNDIMWFLDLGLDLFSEEAAVDMDGVLKRIRKLEGRLDKLKRINYNMSEEIRQIKSEPKIAEENMEEGKCDPSLSQSHSSSPASSIPQTGGPPALKDFVHESVMSLKTTSPGSSSEDRHARRHAKDQVKQKGGVEFFSQLSKLSRIDLKSVKHVYISPDHTDDIIINKSGKDIKDMRDGVSVSVPAQMSNLQLSTVQRNVPLTLSVLNRIKWEHTINYEIWISDMIKEMARHDGFLGMTTIEVPTEENAYINTFSFDTYAHLESFICSKQRLELLKRLDCMLLGASVSAVTEERSFHSVFDELFVSTGGAASLARPPVWKTTLMVIIPLFFLVWCVSSGLWSILTFDLDLAPEIVTLITTWITVSTNTYFGVPIMHLFFGKWHRRHRNVINRNSRLSFLDLGLSRPWQVIILMCYIAVLLLLGFDIIG